MSERQTWVEAWVSAETMVSLLEESEDGVEEHGVARLPRCIQKLPCRHVVVATDTADKPQGTKNLLLGQENLHNLVISGGEPLLNTHRHTQRSTNKHIIKYHESVTITDAP